HRRRARPDRDLPAQRRAGRGRQGRAAGGVEGHAAARDRAPPRVGRGRSREAGTQLDVAADGAPRARNEPRWDSNGAPQLNLSIDRRARLAVETTMELT